MRYFLIAGEASGDFHASNLMRALRSHDPAAEFRYMGGDLMQDAGGGMVMHYRETSYMLLDVVFHLGKILRNMRRIRKEILSWGPDAVIPVDYPGFNLRIARFARSRGIRVFYYISPKVWAWRTGRVKKLKRYTDRLFVILPFEVDFFARRGIRAVYAGNPLVDATVSFRKGFEGAGGWKRARGLDDRPLVALLAGSRRKEIEGVLPAMLRVARQRRDVRYVVAGAPSIDPGLYDRYLEGTDVGIVYRETYGLLASSTAAVVTSGTATLEAALFRVPQVVVYRTSGLAYAIAKRLIKINFISLVNLVLGRELVKEVIQKDLAGRTRHELERILDEPGRRETILEGYREIAPMLGEPGVVDRIGGRMVQELEGRQKRRNEDKETE